MKYIILLFILSNSIFGQNYGPLEPNQGADHGIAKNYSWLENNGIPIVPNVRSEIEINNKTYHYIRTSKDSFKISRKERGRFLDVIPKMKTNYSGRGMNEYSRLLNIYEDDRSVNIYSWGVTGYNFLFYQKIQDQEPRLIRFGSIQNINHTYFAFDQSIESISFSGATQMKIATKPAVEDGTKGYYNFKRPGIYEFRPDGVYLDGIFDPSVADHEPQDVVNENIQKDPQHYLKKQALHAERVANYTKEIMDAEAARVAALAPQPTPKPSVNPTPPEPNPEPAVAPSSIPKTQPATTESESSSNLTPWLAGIVALFVILLGYLGLRFIRKKTKS